VKVRIHCGPKLSRVSASRLGQRIANRFRCPVEVNPTLVHHGLSKGANFHLTSGLDRPIADLYVASVPAAKAVAQLIANAIGEPVGVTRNTVVGKGSIHAPLAGRSPRSMPSRNPSPRPQVGEVWTHIITGIKCEVKAVRGFRIEYLELGTGRRLHESVSEFMATHRPPRGMPRVNPKGRKNPSEFIDRIEGKGGWVSITRTGSKVWVEWDRPGTGSDEAGLYQAPSIAAARDFAEVWAAGGGLGAALAALNRKRNPSRSKVARRRRSATRRGLNRKTFRAASRAARLTRYGAIPGAAAKPIHYLERSRARRHPNPKGRELSVPEKHQLRIARDTLKSSDAGARILGGPTKDEAREIILLLTGRPAPNPRAADAIWVTYSPTAFGIGGGHKFKIESTDPDRPAERYAGILEVNRYTSSTGEEAGAQAMRFPWTRTGPHFLSKSNPRGRNPRRRMAHRDSVTHIFGSKVLDTLTLNETTALFKDVAEIADAEQHGDDGWAAFELRRRIGGPANLKSYAQSLVAGNRHLNPGRRGRNPVSRSIDRRSIRTVGRGKKRVLIGCPKGNYSTRTKRCRIGTRAIDAPGRRARKGPRKARARNPRSPIEAAKAVHRMWQDRDVTQHIRRVRHPMRVPKAVASLGKLAGVIYDSNKYDGKKKRYEHRFKRPLPELTAGPDGRLHIVGGGYKTTADGLVN
jgi:hypothetical protein